MRHYRIKTNPGFQKHCEIVLGLLQQVTDTHDMDVELGNYLLVDGINELLHIRNLHYFSIWCSIEALIDEDELVETVYEQMERWWDLALIIEQEIKPLSEHLSDELNQIDRIGDVVALIGTDFKFITITPA